MSRDRVHPLSAGDRARAAAVAAGMEELEPGMTIGLGSGRAVWGVVEAIAERWSGQPPIRAATASSVTDERARAAGIELIELDGHVQLDLALDGADEIDPRLGLIKGGGAALLREKLVIGASRRFVVVAEAGKRVARLGQTRGVPVEIVRFAWRDTVRRLLELVPEAPLRLDGSGAPVVTDEGHHLVDCTLPADGDLHALAAALKATVGVVEHGLFLDEAELALLGSEDGSIVRLERGG